MYNFSYTGGRAAPQTPLFFFFGTVGGRECKYIVSCSNRIDVLIFVYWGSAAPQTPCILFGTVGAQEYE